MLNKRLCLDKLKKENGYMTVEITLVFSVIFFALIFIMFIGIVLYQQVNLQSLAVKASERGSVIYVSRVGDMSTGIKRLEDFENRDPYRYIPFLDGSKKEEYKDTINGYVATNIGNYNVITGKVKNDSDYVTIKDYVVTKKILVNIKTEYNMPTDAIAKMFGSDGAFNIDTTAVSTVTDSVEFVRNVDLCTDALQANEASEAALQKVGEVQTYIKDWAEVLNK
jgi:hypothetical protein